MPRITPHRPPRHFARARPRVPSRTDRAYDAGARLTEVANTAANGEQVGVRYTLSADDQRVEALEETGQKWQYGYDGLKQLVTAKKTDTATSVVPPLDQSYSYDPMGNRRAYTEQGKSVAYASNSANQYDSVTSTENGTPKTENLRYDRNGNLLTDGLRTYTWDAENQLVAVAPVNPTEGSQRVEYTYDWRMRRKDKKSFVFTAGAWALARIHTFKYHEWNPIEETIAEFTAPGSRTSNLASRVCAKRYVWGNDLSGNLHGAGGVGGLLSMKVSSFSPETSNLKPETYFYAYDGNGNVRALVKADAANPAASAITARYAYDGFGKEVAVGGVDSEKNAFRFSTKQLDAETGMNYYGMRYYAADAGRWINRDPISEKGGKNVYAMAENDAILRFDVMGLWGSGLVVGEGDHGAITRSAMGWDLGLYDESFERWRKLVTDLLVSANLSVDGGEMKDQMEWHYNRPIGGVVAEWIGSYSLNLRVNEVAMNSLIKGSPSRANCGNSLAIMGRLTHAYQDYYAHAIAYDSDGSKGTIGEISGSPSNPLLKPSSWNHVLKRGEHGATEPASRSPDRDRRYALAMRYTEAELGAFLRSWWPKCKCYTKGL